MRFLICMHHTKCLYFVQISVLIYYLQCKFSSNCPCTIYHSIIAKFVNQFRHLLIGINQQHFFLFQLYLFSSKSPMHPAIHSCPHPFSNIWVETVIIYHSLKFPKLSPHHFHQPIFSHNLTSVLSFSDQSST